MRIVSSLSLSLSLSLSPEAPNVPSIGRARPSLSSRTPRRPLAVIEQAAESQPPTDPALETARGPDAFDQLIPLPLMIALAMIVTDKFRDRVSEMALA
jgi:hypothetical protein